MRRLLLTENITADGRIEMLVDDRPAVAQLDGSLR
jgi:hypothetical protein